MAIESVLNWIVRALSFFNTITLLWLGLAVLLNAERRRLGTVLAGTGLVVGGAFFAGHTTIVSRELGTFDSEMEFWWRVGWIPFVSAPYIWYAVMAWYSDTLRNRSHQVALCLLGMMGLVALTLIFFVSPLPSYSDVLGQRHPPGASLGGIPVMVVLYPAYSAVCILLSLLALRAPSGSGRLMGDLARERARPSLVAAAVVLLLVSVLVGGLAAWFVRAVQSGVLVLLAPDTLRLLKLFDMGITGLLAIVVVLVGRATASYEIFTGKALPRGGLARQWRNSLVLGASFGGVMAISLDIGIDPIFRLVLATVVVTVLYALHSWSVYVDRESSMNRLRPFVTSERLYDRLFGAGEAGVATDSARGTAAAPFEALCRDVLGTRVAYLVALGPLAPLAGPPLVYPTGGSRSWLDAARIGDLRSLLASDSLMCLPVDAERFGSASWAVPLWSERGLIGTLFLGAKTDERLYTQEELEIARSTCERLVDLLASAEMARRLVLLQRQHLAESRIVDARARHALHDQILPSLHAALLTLSSVSARSGSRTAAHPEQDLADETADVARQLAAVHRDIAELLHTLPSTVAPRLAQAGLFGALRHVVDSEMAGGFNSVRYDVSPDADAESTALPPLTAEVIFGAAREAIRNAALHGRGEDPAHPLDLTITARAVDGLAITIEDDGVGLVRPASVGSDWASGDSGEPVVTGHGLMLHSTMMALVGGTFVVEPASGSGTRVSLTCPRAVLTSPL